MEYDVTQPTCEEATGTIEVGEEPIPHAAEVTDATQRLAEEFLMLAEEFPQFVSIDQLPDGVLDRAAQQGISLLDAYLRHRLQEEKKVAAAVAQRQQAAAQSAGSLSCGAAETPPEQDAFLKAFRAAL